MTKTWEDLPQECWELIVRRLHDLRHLESFSLVCKLFLSLSDRNRSSLTLSSSAAVSPMSLHFLCRFQNLKRLHFHHPEPELYRLLSILSQSQLNLESLTLSNQTHLPITAVKYLGKKMKTLKCFRVSRFKSLEDWDLAVLVDSFPNLEELDISYPEDGYLGTVSDEGIRIVSLKLGSLRAINLSGNHFLTDKSLSHLLTNCPLMAEIKAIDCSFFTQMGIVSAIRGNFNRSLSCLDLSFTIVQDDMLFEIAELNLKLKKVALSRCPGYTFVGIFRFLEVYHQSLTYLDIEGAYFLRDDLILKLSPYLANLTFLNVSYCCLLTNWAFFHLVKSSHYLAEIQMEMTALGEGYVDNDLIQNSTIRTLKLGRNKYLDDDTLKSIGVSCPKLLSLDLRHCWNVTEDGIRELGTCCVEIKELTINGCDAIKNLSYDFEFSKLEILSAEGSGIEDEWLSLAGKYCENLWNLNLGSCLGVTERGVEELVAKCKCLRVLNLQNCSNVSLRVEILAKMVFSRPSLKKIVLPDTLYIKEKQRNLLLRHGCIVCSS